MNKYSPEITEFIRENSWGASARVMAEMVNERFGTDFTPSAIKQFRQRRGIKSGCTGWYQKGHPPGNKGKKLEEYVTDPERVKKIREAIASTQFKKGESPMNEKPVGSIVTNREGYKLRKRQMEGEQWERWEPLHRYLWEQNYGPIPEGMMIIFKDGDRSNCELSNLAIISKQENAALNKLGLRSSDPELTDAGINVVRLRFAAKEARKRRKNER